MNPEGYREVKKALKAAGVRAKIRPKLTGHRVAEFITIHTRAAPLKVSQALGRLGLLAEPGEDGNFPINHARPSLDPLPSEDKKSLHFKDVNFE